MARRRSAVDAEIDAVYALVPDARCKGLCQSYCGPIYMTGRERARVAEAGFDVPPGDEGIREVDRTGTYRCPALDDDGRCGAYDVRPLICRFFGAVESDVLVCPYGCGPVEKLSLAEARRLAEKVEAIGGKSY